MNGHGITAIDRFRKIGQGLLAVASQWSVAIVALVMGLGCLAPLPADSHGTIELTVPGELLPTGVHITPTAAAGAIFQPLNPDLPNNPDFTAGQEVATSVSPDGNTLLIVTSGFNRNYAPDGSPLPDESNEYVFVYDISGHPPVKKQVLQVPNTFNGIAWHPNAREFYVVDGVDDNVHIFESSGGVWSEAGAPILLGHTAGEGLEVAPMAAGMAVNASGTRLLVANFENDSVSVVDLTKRDVAPEIDLRPGKIDPALQGVPGGEFPFCVAIKGDQKAYVSSQRDREVVVLDLSTSTPTVIGRIPVRGQPNKMILNRTRTHLYVANDNSDTVAVIDTGADHVLEEISTTAPKVLFPNLRDFKGSNPNSLALSADERTLFVTNGGTNSLAVIRLWRMEDQKRSEDEDDEEEEEEHGPSRVIGLIPTGWYPNAVSLNKQGSVLYVVNGKSNAGPNPGACRDTLSIEPGALDPCTEQNLYMWKLTKAGFHSLPVPSGLGLAKLTWQVAENNNFPAAAGHQKDHAMMKFLRGRIKHVIYIVKENRTYDQVLGDLEVGNGDPNLALFRANHPESSRVSQNVRHPR